MQFAGAFDVVRNLCDVVVEVSPHTVLRNYVKAISPSTGYMFLQRRNFDSAPLLLQCLAQLFVSGVDVKWLRVEEAASRGVAVSGHRIPSIVWSHTVRDPKPSRPPSQLSGETPGKQKLNDFLKMIFVL